MNKRIYLGILYLVTGLVVFGCIGIRSCNNKGVGFFGKIGKEYLSGDMAEESYTNIKDVKKIVVDTTVAEITLIEGNDYSVSYSGNKEYRVSAGCSGDVLNVTSVNKKKNFINNGINVKAKVEITYPKGETFELVEISGSVGNLRIEGINTKEIDIDCNVGDISIKDSVLKNGTIKNDVGDVTLDTVSFEDISVETNVGNIVIVADCEEDECNIEAEAGVGKIRIGENKYEKSANIKNKGADLDINAETGVGDVKITFKK